MRNTISQNDAHRLLDCLEELVAIIGPLRGDTAANLLGVDGMAAAFNDAKRLSERLGCFKEPA